MRTWLQSERITTIGEPDSFFGYNASIAIDFVGVDTGVKQGSSNIIANLAGLGGSDTSMTSELVHWQGISRIGC